LILLVRPSEPLVPGRVDNGSPDWTNFEPFGSRWRDPEMVVLCPLSAYCDRTPATEGLTFTRQLRDGQARPLPRNGRDGPVRLLHAIVIRCHLRSLREP
jgi:hypothetical protein